VFHPNSAPHAVCIGDNWTAGESLDVLIQRVGEILAYQSYNTKSPLNGRAAQWVDSNRDRVPVDREEFYVDLSAAPELAPRSAASACSNCAATGPLTACAADHMLCGDCTMRCSTCTRVICLTCGDRTCGVCADPGTI
jgi:hypothetical protein